MRKRFCIAWIVLCSMAFTGCREVIPQDSQETYREEGAAMSSGTMSSEDEHAKTAIADSGEADAPSAGLSEPRTIGGGQVTN